MTFPHTLAMTLVQVPYTPIKMAYLIKKCHRCDSNLRNVLNQLKEKGCVEKIEGKTPLGNKKAVWWKRVKGAKL